MYGEGLTTLSARYTSNGSANVRLRNLCDRTSWNTSPAWMCSFVAATASRNSALVIVESVGGVGGCVSDMDTSPKGSVGAVAGCSAFTSAAKFASPSASAASASPSCAVTSTQCTANSCFVAWSKTTTSRYRPRHRSGSSRSSSGAAANGSFPWYWYRTVS